MIDEKKLIEKLKKEISETYHEDCILAFERAIEIVKEQPKVVEWIPANQPPTEFNIFGYSDDVLLKVKWKNENEDNDITYDIGWYYGKGSCWNVEHDSSRKVIAWMPLPKPSREEKTNE